MTIANFVCPESLDQKPLVNMKASLGDFSGLIHSLAVRYVAPGVDLEDLEQEAAVAVLQAQWSEETTKSSLKNFICFRIRDALKRYRHFNRIDRMGPLVEVVSLDEEVSKDDDGESLTRHEVVGTPSNQEGAEEGSRAVRLLESLPLDVQQVIRLRAEGLTFPQIGKSVGKSSEAVKKTWQRVQPQLTALRVAA